MIAAGFALLNVSRAQFVEIDISAQVNADIRTYYNGTNDYPGGMNNYQAGGTELDVDGVPFALAELNSDAASTGVIQTGLGRFGLGAAGFDYVLPVPGGTHATALYTLINSTDGGPGASEGSIVVAGTEGETATLNLVEGVNIRDHNDGEFVNTLSDSTVVPTYFTNGLPAANGPVRLDRQVLLLPTTFLGDTIASITFQGYAQGATNGSPFLAGLTLLNLAPPAFSQQPSNQVVGAGQGFRFAAQATGFPPPQYQWQFSTNGVNWLNLNGATGTGYSLSASGETNIGYYRLEAYNSQGTNYSLAADLGLLDLGMYAGINLYGPINANYVIQSTPNLNSNWTTLTNVSIPSQPYIYIDYTSLTNAKKFYRANPQ